MVASYDYMMLDILDSTQINHSSYKLKLIFGNLLSFPSYSLYKIYDCVFGSLYSSTLSLHSISS